MRLRHKGGRFRLLPKILMSAFVLTMFGGLLGSGPAVADGANDRITQFINLMKNKNGDGGESIKITDLKKSDAQFLGVFMSNFFVPYTTEIGYADSNSEAAAEAKTSMKKLLGDVGITDPDTQIAFTEYIFEQSRNSTSKDMQWYFSDKPPTTVTAADMVQSKQTKNSVYNLQKMVSGMYMLGYSRYDNCNGKEQRAQIKECYAAVYADGRGSKQALKEGSDPDLVINQNKHYAYLASADKKSIAFSTDLFLEETTPSAIAFANASSLVDPKKGYGTSLFDYSEEDVKAGSLKSDNLLASSIFGTPVQMDGFGNLIAMGPNHQYIIMPGAMNPYTWQAVTKTGELDGTKPVGSVLNVMNFPMLSKSVDGQVVKSCDVEASKCAINTKVASDLSKSALVTVNGAPDDYPDDDNAPGHKNGNQAPMSRLLRGSETTEMLAVKGTLLGLGNKSNKEGEALRKLIGDYTKANLGKDIGANINHDKINGSGEYNKNIRWMYLPYFGNAVYSLPENASMSVFAKGAGFDVTGEFGKDDKAVADTMTKDGTVTVLDSSGKTSGSKGSLDASKSLAFLNDFSKSTKSGQLLSVTLDPSEMQTLYFTYLMAMDWGSNSEAAKDLNGSLGYRISSSNLPKLDTGNFEFSDAALAEMKNSGLEQRDEDIRNWTWYLLNPSQGFEYVTSLVTNKTTSFLMSNHANIVGATNAPAVAGSTKYLGFSGYVTMPELTDLPWTDAAMKWYNSNWMYISLGMIIILGFYALTGVITLQKAIGGAILFSILAMVPANLVNFSVGVSNNITNAIYGEKFTYWALLQNQSYAQAIEDAAGEDNYNDYLRKQMAANANLNITGIQNGAGQNSSGTNSVVVKWQAPKKMVSLMASDTDSAMNDAADETGSQILKQGVAGIQDLYSGESYMDNDSVYLYRSYIDLSNYSRFIYRGIQTEQQKIIASVDTSKWPASLKKAWDNQNDFTRSVENGYTNPNNGSNSVAKAVRIQAPMSSKIVADAFGQAAGMDKLTQSSMVGIDTRAFNFNIKPFNDGSSIMKGVQETTKKLAESNTESTYGTFDPKMGKGYTDADYAGLASYSLMSESSFYYFAWNLYDQGLQVDVGATGGYKNKILGTDGRDFFYNVKGNDEMKDFSDMKSLFTYTIPYLKAGNNVVRQFDQVYGLKYEKGVPTTEGYSENPEIKNNPEMKQKYWKNLNISRLYGLYSPWVDLMYDASYADSETVSFQGQDIKISDPIDPASYPENRPMVFSKSEQADWGLKDDQLTQVELQIQKVTSNTQKKMYGLLNAYNYDDNVLVTAAAINTTFEFNKEFSESKPFGANIQIYPQSYELKNFSYDAFLRLILSNSTGDSISGQSATDFYTSIVQKSSMFTAGVLLANDVLSSYVIPAAKVFGLIAVSLTAILMLVASCIRIEEDLFKNLIKALILPLIGMISIFVGMALVVSWFMSSGNTAVTGYDGISISLGDPVMVLLAMLGINCVVLLALYKLFRYMIGNLIRYGKGIGSSMTAVLKGSGSAVKSLAQGQGISAARSAAGVSAAPMSGSGVGGNVDRGDGRISGEALERMRRNSQDDKFGQIGRSSKGTRRPATEDPKPKERTFNDDSIESGVTSSRMSAVSTNGQGRVRSDSSSGASDPFMEEGLRRESESKGESRRGYFNGDKNANESAEGNVKVEEAKPESAKPSNGRKPFDFDGF